jgi:hypothetical protein
MRSDLSDGNPVCERQRQGMLQAFDTRILLQAFDPRILVSFSSCVILAGEVWLDFLVFTTEIELVD